MARRSFLVSYDVADDKRRDKLFRLLDGEGDHAQYSVFLCEFSPTELATLRSRVREIIHDGDDQVMLLDLGPADRPLDQCLEVLGSPYQPLVRTLVV